MFNNTLQRLAIGGSLALAALALAPGCGALGRPASDHSVQAGHARCPVCELEGDLACVDVEIRPQTPRLEYAGRTYYFCSAQCRRDFASHPERYGTP